MGTECDDNDWDINDATVVCRKTWGGNAGEMGKGGNKAYKLEGWEGKLKSNIMVYGVQVNV